VGAKSWGFWDTFCWGNSNEKDEIFAGAGNFRGGGEDRFSKARCNADAEARGTAVGETGTAQKKKGLK